MRLYEVLGSSNNLWSYIWVWPLKFDDVFKLYLADRCKLFGGIFIALLLIVFYTSLAYSKYFISSTYLLHRILAVVFLFTWAFPVGSLQMHFICSGSSLIKSLNRVSLKFISLQSVQEIQVLISRLTLAIFLYYGPFLTRLSYSFQYFEVFYAMSTNLQLAGPFIFHLVSLFLICHSLIQFSIGLILVKERQLLNCQFTDLSHFHELLSHSDRIYEDSMKLTKFFYTSSLLKATHMLLDLVTNFFAIMDDMYSDKKMFNTVLFYFYNLLSDAPIFVMFYFSQSYSDPRKQVCKAISGIYI